MYLPPAFDDHRRPDIAAALRASGYGHLVTVAGTGGSAGDDDSAGHGAEPVPQATALPFLVDDELTVVKAHLARANPHWRAMDRQRGLLIVSVADGYVSPRWYPSKAEHGKVVPTWNYELIHLHGRLRVDDRPEARREVVTELTDRHEASVDDGGLPWAVDDAPDDFIERQLRAIVAIRLEIDRIEAKRKLSQNRPEADRQGVIDALATSTDPGDQQLVARMVLDDEQ